MNDVTLIGIDLGKHCFHLHGQDEAGRMVFRKKLTRSQMLTLLGNFPPCTVVMEACAGAPKHRAFYFVHAGGRWERIGTDIAEARRRGILYNDPDSEFGLCALPPLPIRDS